jgi:hypothetical protein
MAEASEDGFWQFEDGEWNPTQKQLDAIQQGAIRHDVDPIPQETQSPETTNFHSPQPSLTPHQTGQNHFLIVSSAKDNGTKKVLMIGAGFAIVLLLLVILSSVLYVWASSLAEGQDENLVGVWTNPQDKLQLLSNGEAKESTGTFETWYTKGDSIYFEYDEYYNDYKYLLVDEVLFLAPYDEDGALVEENCIAYLEGTRGESQSFYNDRIERADSDGDFPSWCNPE